MMADNVWKTLLTQWSKDVLSSMYASDLPPEVRASDWIGYTGATDEQIIQAEARLNVELPPSYKAFLTISNGFRMPGSFVPRLFSVDEIEWFRDNDPHTVTEWIRQAKLHGESVSDDKYFVYGEEQDCINFRAEYLETALLVSEREIAGSAVYLLNPRIVTGDGEWEAWDFAHWYPGAHRYRSFLDLMKAKYQSFLYLKEHEEK